MHGYSRDDARNWGIWHYLWTVLGWLAFSLPLAIYVVYRLA